MTTSPRRLPGEGSQRERRSGVWEIRVPTGPDPATGRTRHRSVTLHGTLAQAHAVRRELAATCTTPRLPPSPLLTVGELLPAWLGADHLWKPSTLVGYRSTVAAVVADPIARTRVMGLSPRALRAVVDRWRQRDPATRWPRPGSGVLRSAIGWAWDERLIESHPVRFMRGPSRVPPRRPLTEDEVRTLLAAAELRMLEAHVNHDPATGKGNGGVTGPNRTCCWSGWPPTPGPAVASSPPSRSPISTAGYSASTAPCLPEC